MTKTLLVAREEFRQTVATKAFWIGLAAFPVIVALGIAVPLLLNQAKQARPFAVVDHSGFLLQEIECGVYGEDLAAMAMRGRDLRRQDSDRFSALPRPVRNYVKAWMALEEAQRPDLVEQLVTGACGHSLDPSTDLPMNLSGDPSPDSLPDPLIGTSMDFVVAGGAALHQWWATVEPDQAENLYDMELTRGRFVRRSLTAGADTIGVLNEQIGTSELFAYFVIDADPIGKDDKNLYVSNNLTDRDLRNWFSSRANDIVRKRRMAREGIAVETADWMQTGLHFEARQIDARGDVEEVKGRDKFRQFVPLVFTYLLWIAVFTSAQMLITSTIEEKSARIMEILVSSVTPEELMTGKIAGVAGAGMIVVGSWVSFFLAAVVVVPRLLGADIEGFVGVAADPLFLATFVIYFLLGYLLYAAYLVGIGSLCGTLKEAQNIMWPAMIPLFTAIFSMPHIIQDPNGLLARILSFVPPMTPFIMMNRAAGPPAWWEMVLTGLLLIVSIWLTIKGAARLFRVGVLAAGARPGLGDIVRIVFTPPPTADRGSVRAAKPTNPDRAARVHPQDRPRGCKPGHPREHG